ncbi:MAG TPA: transposase [bacterium]|nr:transposase [bacterium]
MARPWRIEFPEAVYHVTARGNNRAAIVLDDSDRRDFLGLLAAAALRFNLKIFAFCLMTNHYHLFLRTPDANLTRAMHWLNATYTIRFNRRHRRAGHIFQGRYKALLVADTAHWSVLSIYIHLNPVRARIADHPADYEWSSFRDYTRARPRYDWLRPNDVLAPYGVSPAARRRRYTADLMARSAERRAYWKDFQAAMTEAAREEMQTLAPRHPPRGNKATVPEFKLASPRPDLPMGLAQIAELFGTDAQRLVSTRRNGPARLAAYWHLTRNLGIRYVDVGVAFGVTGSAVGMGVKRFAAMLKTEKSLQTIARRLMLYVET